VGFPRDVSVNCTANGIRPDVTFALKDATGTLGGTTVTVVDWVEILYENAFDALRLIVKSPIDVGKNVACWVLLKGISGPTPDTLYDQFHAVGLPVLVSRKAMPDHVVRGPAGVKVAVIGGG